MALKYYRLITPLCHYRRTLTANLRSLGAAAALLLALAAAPVVTTTAAPAAAPAATDALRIQVDHAWIRWLPAGLPAGGYMSLTNRGDAAVNLVAASSPAYAEVSIHRNVEKLNKQMSQEWDDIFKRHEPADAAPTGATEGGK